MPTYSYRCPECGTEIDHFCAIADRDNAPECCQKAMVRQVTAPNLCVRVDAHYICPMTGEGVTTRRRRQYLMDKHNVVDASDFASNREKQLKRRQADRELAAQATKDLPREVFAAAQQAIDQRMPG